MSRCGVFPSGVQVSGVDGITGFGPVAPASLVVASDGRVGAVPVFSVGVQCASYKHMWRLAESSSRAVPVHRRPVMAAQSVLALSREELTVVPSAGLQQHPNSRVNTTRRADSTADAGDPPGAKRGRIDRRSRRLDGV